MPAEDGIYRRPRGHIVDFAFDDSVASVFPDMIRRSVPGYETVIPVTGLLAARELRAPPPERRAHPPERRAHAPERRAHPPERGALAYDLGCSLGATTLAMLRYSEDVPCRVIAVDNAPAMIDRARIVVTDPRVTFECADIRSVSLEPARAVVLNYVLQFLPPADRPDMLRRIRAALEPDGLLLLSEKIRFEDAATQSEYEAAHLDYKRANGYSELEISQKRTALENVMIIDTEAQHRERLAAAGFSRVRKWYQCLNWASFEARP